MRDRVTEIRFRLEAHVHVPDREESPQRAMELDDGLAGSAVVSDRPLKSREMVSVVSAALLGRPRRPPA